MPLLAYFGTVGAVLLAMLLLASFILAPSRPGGALPNAAAEANLSKPRTLSRVEQYSATPRIVPVQGGFSSPDPVPAAAPAIVPSDREQRQGGNAVEAKPVPRTTPTSKTAQRGNNGNSGSAWRRLRRDPGASSYAQDLRGNAPGRGWSQSSAEGTLGPH